MRNTLTSYALFSMLRSPLKLKKSHTLDRLIGFKNKNNLMGRRKGDLDRLKEVAVY